MENQKINQNKYSEVIKPVRILEKQTSGRKKGLVILGIMMLVFCGAGVFANAEKLNINLPMEFRSSQTLNNSNFSPWNNTPIDPNLILNMPKSSTRILYG